MVRGHGLLSDTINDLSLDIELQDISTLNKTELRPEIQAGRGFRKFSVSIDRQFNLETLGLNNPEKTEILPVSYHFSREFYQLYRW